MIYRTFFLLVICISIYSVDVYSITWHVVPPKVEWRADSSDRELLPNGIQLPRQWPPRDYELNSIAPIPVPYLLSPPEVISIHFGRQLFIDDFLVEETDMTRVYHAAKKYEGNPILVPTSPRELDNGNRSGATPHSGGVWYDSREGKFKMWYMMGWYNGQGYAYSEDGLHWIRPNLGFEPQSNFIPDPSPDMRWGMDHVRLDWDTQNEAHRFKSLHYYHKSAEGWGGRVHFSPDGIHWASPVETGPMLGDRNTFFYNPFRKKWIFSLKADLRVDSVYKRTRAYVEHSDFVEGAKWNKDDIVNWVRTDEFDIPDPNIGDHPQIYDLDAVAYESLMIGLFQIHLGPNNRVCEAGKFPKITELHVGYSRDGFHWYRPIRTPFINATREEGDWERAYLHGAGGVCLVVRDSLYFYYGGFSGQAPNGNDMYAGGSTGLAFLRRDGFASMEAGKKTGTLLTRQVTFSGKHLFVNVDCSEGELRVEILDERDRVLKQFTAKASHPICTDKTLQKVEWEAGDDLSALVGKRVKFRFHLTNGKLYSFWVSPDESGASHGYVGAGGPGYDGVIDDKGIKAY